MSPRSTAPAEPEGPRPHPAVVLVHGSDPFLVEEAAEAVLGDVAPDWRTDDFKVTRIAGYADKTDDAAAVLRAVREALRQPGFFAADPIVWLRELSFAGNDRASRSEGVHALLDDFRNDLRANGVPPGGRLLVTSSTISKACGLFKTLQAMAREGRAEIVDAGGGSADAVRRLLARKCKENGWSMSPAVVAAFIGRIGTDGNTAVRELEKLFCYTGGAEPTPEDVAEICTLSQEGVIWEIADVFGRRDLPGTIATIRKLLSNKRISEVALIIFLEQRINDLSLLADARERGLLAPDGRSWSPALGPADREAVAALGKADVLAKPSFQKIPIVEQAARWTAAQTRRARIAIMHGHERLVTGTADAQAVLESAVCAALA